MSLFFFSSSLAVLITPQGGKRLRSSSSPSWAGFLTAILSTRYAASQCVSAGPPGGAPALFQQPRTPTPRPSVPGSSPVPLSASPPLAEGRLHAVAAAGPCPAPGLCAISILAIFSSCRSAVGFTWLHFCGSQVIHTCITRSLDVEVPVHHICLIAPFCCADRI